MDILEAKIKILIDAEDKLLEINPNHICYPEQWFEIWEEYEGNLGSESNLGFPLASPIVSLSWPDNSSDSDNKSSTYIL